MLDDLILDDVRTAQSKGLSEHLVQIGHGQRNSLIPVVTLIALGIPGIFDGATITAQIFRVNGLGRLLRWRYLRGWDSAGSDTGRLPWQAA